MKIVALAAAALLAAWPACAAQTSPAQTSSDRASSSARAVELGPLGLPVILDGRVVNYVFLDVRLELRSGADTARVRERAPYLRDLLVRVAHRQPFSRPGDPLRLDEGRIRAVLMQAAPGLVGRGQVEGVDIVTQTPQRRTGLPRSQAGARAIIP